MTIESRRSIWIAAGVLALVFLAGGLAGAAISLFADRPHFPRQRMMERIALPEIPPAPHGPGGIVFYKRLGDEFGAELDLDEEQAARVDSMMQVQRQKADSLLESMHPRLKALMDSTNADIEAILTEEQRERFRQMQERRHEVLIRRRVPAPPQPPGPPGTWERRAPAQEGEGDR
jgi:Spy/CpxP family protein refolding chaperone